MVVAIDASSSMNHGEFSRFEKAVASAKQVLRNAREGDPVSLVLMSSHPSILQRRTGFDTDKFHDILDKQARPTPYRLNLEQNLEQLESLVQELKTPVKECYLITDAQEADWNQLSDRAKATFARLKEQASVFVVPVKADGEDNLSITDLRYASGSLHRSGVARILARVRNHGRRKADGGTIEFYVGDALVTRQAVGPLEPGETRGVSFFTSFQNSGDVRLRAHLAKDDLIEDNDRSAVAHIRPKLRVLCASTAPAEDAENRTGAYYAIKALQLLETGPDGPVTVNRVSATDLSLETLSNYDVLLMADVADVAPEMVKRIDRFVRRGGGLILFPGERVKSDIYNQRFGTGVKGLLPAKFGETIAVEKDQTGWTLAPIQSSHPLAAIAQRLPKEILDAVRFEKLFTLEPAAGSRTILALAGSRAPVLLLRDVGAGSVLLFATSADRTWSQFPLHPLFAMLLRQSVTNMTSRPGSRDVIVGTPGRIAAPGRRVGETVQLTDPAKETSTLKVTQAAQQPVCEIPNEQTGVYEVAGDKTRPALLLASNLDPSESDVRFVDAAVLAGTLDAAGVKVVTESGALTKEIERSRQGRELARFLLIAGILVFVLQSLLARYFTNRMSEPDTDVAASLQMSQVVAARRS